MTTRTAIASLDARKSTVSRMSSPPGDTRERHDASAEPQRRTSEQPHPVDGPFRALWAVPHEQAPAPRRSAVQRDVERHAPETLEELHHLSGQMGPVGRDLERRPRVGAADQGKDLGESRMGEGLAFDDERSRFSDGDDTARIQEGHCAGDLVQRADPDRVDGDTRRVVLVAAEDAAGPAAGGDGQDVRLDRGVEDQAVEFGGRRSIHLW